MEFPLCTRMLNWIWLSMVVIAILVGGFGGRLDTMTAGMVEIAETSVMKIALPLIGLWAVWLGMMRLAERGGLVQSLSMLLLPVMTRLFPQVPKDHPAMGSMVMAMAANMLGLGNSATPLGLRAMAQLNQLNDKPGSASNAMVTFLVICTASIQLLPTTAIAILAVNAAGRAVRAGFDPTSIVAPALISTVCALAVGLVLARALSGLRAFAPVADANEQKGGESPSSEIAAEAATPQQVTAIGKWVMRGYLLSFLLIFLALVWPMYANQFLQWLRGLCGLADGWQFAAAWPEVTNPGLRAVRATSLMAIPFMLSFFPLYAALRGVRVYEQFCEGAKEAFPTAQRIIPYLVAMLVAIRLLRDSGTMDFIITGLKPLMATLHFPPELLPLCLMRPLSGGASLGIMTDLVKTHGPDSLIGLTAATIYGSTETTFYVIAVYFGSVGVKNPRHAVLAGLAADITAQIVAVTVCNLMFS